MGLGGQVISPSGSGTSNNKHNGESVAINEKSQCVAKCVAFGWPLFSL